MQKTYNQLSLQERERICELRWTGVGLGQIAGDLGRSKSTIARELRRNGSSIYRCYMPHQAQNRADQRRRQASQRPRLKNERIRSYVRAMLTEWDWSPEIIAGRLRQDDPASTISHEAIYQYIYDPRTADRNELVSHLRRAHRHRRKKGPGRRTHKMKIPNRIPIDDRPSVVANRHQFGHWEGDSLVSRQSAAALNSLVERKSRLLRLSRLERNGAVESRRAVVRRLKGLPGSALRTLTLDNGSENARHEEVTAALGLRCYFCHPYHAWERGSNENVNGLVRWYLPKGTDFSTLTSGQIAWVEAMINNRPRKCLGFRTPIEVASRFVALRG